MEGEEVARMRERESYRGVPEFGRACVESVLSPALALLGLAARPVESSGR